MYVDPARMIWNWLSLDGGHCQLTSCELSPRGVCSREGPSWEIKYMHGVLVRHILRDRRHVNTVYNYVDTV